MANATITKLKTTVIWRDYGIGIGSTLLNKTQSGNATIQRVNIGK
jgi:hypothetical protein